MNKNLKKNREIDGSYFSLQKFDKFFKCEVHSITGNGNHVKMI